MNQVYEELEQRLHQTQAVLNVAQSLGSSLNATEVARRAAREVTRFIGSDTSIFFEVDAATGYAVAVAGYHVPPHLLDQSYRIALKGLPSFFMGARQPIAADDVLNDPRLDHPAIRGLSVVPRSMLYVPIVTRGRITAALVTYWWTASRLVSDGEIDVVTAIGQQLLLALDNARLYAHEERRRRAVETLARIGVSLTASLDVATVSQQIVEGVHELLGTKTSTLRLLEPDGSLRGLAFGGPLRETLSPGDALPAGVSIAALVIATGGAAWSRDALRDPRITLTEPLRAAFEGAGVGSLLAVPLRVRGQVIGVLSVGDVAGRAFGEAEIDLLQVFADQAAVAVDNARLYREAVEASRQVTETQAQLLQAQKLEAVGRLAGGIAHDFNNVLTVIQGHADLLLRRVPTSDRARHDVETIATTVERANTLIRQLLAFSRHQPLEFAALELNVVVRDMLNMLRQLIGPEIVLDIVLDPAAGLVHANRGQLQQVVLNLVLNARDAMAGRGRLHIATANVDVDERLAARHVDLQPGERYVALTVADTGTGMTPEVEAHIFEPFFTTKTADTGTGLGLATVYGIVKQSGGAITVDSRVGHGSTFTIYMPRAV